MSGRIWKNNAEYYTIAVDQMMKGRKKRRKCMPKEVLSLQWGISTCLSNLIFPKKPICIELSLLKRSQQSRKFMSPSRRQAADVARDTTQWTPISYYENLDFHVLHDSNTSFTWRFFETARQLLYMVSQRGKHVCGRAYINWYMYIYALSS